MAIEQLEPRSIYSPTTLPLPSLDGAQAGDNLTIVPDGVQSGHLQ